MDINVIGGSGFIGTRLCLRLQQNKKYSFLRIVDKVISKKYPQISVAADVRSIEDLQDGLTDGAILINLAAEHRDDVTPLSLYDDVNVTGAENICKVARMKNIKKIIFTSSVAVYGFAPIETRENGNIAPFNDYGRTKYEAEQIFVRWQAEMPSERTLVIVRPTVVFGERNRGNVYNLLRQIALGRFAMIGSGENRKSIAYVENVAAFLEFAINFKPGVHIYNFVDKPDYMMNTLVKIVNKIIGKSDKVGLRLPYFVGYSIGKCFDFLAKCTGKKMTISSIRVKKFCANSVFDTSIAKTGFISPVPLQQALEQTVRYEFVESHDQSEVFYTE